MARPRLTPTQRQILEIAKRHGRVSFGLGQRRGLFYIINKDGGAVISAYGTPEWFLRARGLLEYETYSQAGPVNAGRWYVLTPAGEAAIAPAQPRSPR